MDRTYDNQVAEWVKTLEGVAYKELVEGFAKVAHDTLRKPTSSPFLCLACGTKEKVIVLFDRVTASLDDL